MNEIIMTGRISSDLTSNYVAKGNDTTCVLTFNFAVPDRTSKKDADGNYQTDYFRIVAFSGLAEILEKYANKGDKILIKGKLKNNNYEKDGQKVYSNEIVLNEVEFLENKKDKKEKGK